MFRLLATLVLCTCVASAAELALKVADKAPPVEINESIRSLLQSKAVQLVEGDKPVIELWLAKELNLQSKPSSPATALDALKQTAVLGAAAFASPRRDYREPGEDHRQPGEDPRQSREDSGEVIRRMATVRHASPK